MPAAGTRVTVRMYNPGFGDCFVITATTGRRVWRMLIDCGVHPHGRARPIAETVEAVVADLAAAAPTGSGPRLDVLAATHRHADHISGFARPDWDAVTVGEVWLPFVEDPTDADAVALRAVQDRAAARITQLTALAAQRSPALNLATAMAENSSGNAVAMARLTSGRFANTATVRYLPAPGDPKPQLIDTTVDAVKVHVLGPPRDLAHLKRMDPPAAVAWLAPESPVPGLGGVPLFDPRFILPEDQVSAQMAELARTAKLSRAGNFDDELLAAAAALEHAVNNTSLFLAITVGTDRLVFPGDAQQGAWEHVMGDPDRAALVDTPTLYKVGHHGSHNATPKPYVTEHFGDGAWAMLPYGRVPAWSATIPKAELLAALAEHETKLVRADQPQPQSGVTVDPAGLWTEITIPLDRTPATRTPAGSAT